MLVKSTPHRIAWKDHRDRIDFVRLMTDWVGPPVRRAGSRLIWHCPLCEDSSGHFSVRAGDKSGKCFRCGGSADAPAVVMKVEGLTFPEAVNLIVNGVLPGGNRTDRPPPIARPIDPGSAKPTGMPYNDVLALVIDAERRLWSSEGSEALAYLTGPERCLTPETIRSARLGWTPRASGVAWTPPGIVTPWFVGERLAMAKVRPDRSFRERLPKGGRPPKYLEAYRDPSILRCYPGAATIRPGRPLIVTEGEFDALLLAQELGETASIVTLGSASTRPERPVLDLALKAPTWFLATDADTAGEKAFTSWPARARRVRPPGTFKDWTDAKAGRVNLARWWRDILSGNPTPALHTWDELATWRWGPAVDDPAPGIVRP